MLRDLIKEGGLYTVANLLTKGLSLLLIPFYTTYFSPADYGIIDILVVFGAFFNAVISLQLSQGLGRYVGEDKISDVAKIKFASTAILFNILGYLVIGAIFVLFTNPMIQLLSSDVLISESIFLLSLGSIIINGIFYSFGVYFRFLRKTKAFSLISFGHAFGNIALTLLLVLVFDLGISAVFIATLIVTPVLILIQIILLKKHLIYYIGKTELSLLLNFSLPLIPAAISYALLSFTDRIFINEYLNSAELGIYGIGAKFTSIIALVIAGFSMALNPIIYQKHRDEHTPRELSKIFHLYIAIGTLGVLILSAFSLETLKIFTQIEYHGAFTIMPILYFSVFFTGIWMFSPGLNIKKKTQITGRIVLISSVLNVILNYLFIKELGLVGTAIATLTSTALNNVLLFYWANKYYPVKFSAAKVFGLNILMLPAIYFSSYWVYEQSFNMTQIYLTKSIVIAIFIAFVLASKIIDPNYIYRIKRKFSNEK